MNDVSVVAQPCLEILSHPAFITVLSGTLVYSIGQAIVMFVLLPLQEFIKIKGDISYRLKFYANAYTHFPLADSTQYEVYEKLRRAGCDLERIYATIPMRWLFRWILPSEKDIAKAISLLIAIANGTGTKDQIRNNERAADQIRGLLRIQDYQNV